MVSTWFCARPFWACAWVMPLLALSKLCSRPVRAVICALVRGPESGVPAFSVWTALKAVNRAPPMLLAS